VFFDDDDLSVFSFEREISGLFDGFDEFEYYMLDSCRKCRVYIFFLQINLFTIYSCSLSLFCIIKKTF
jgi:hypothetical protein